MKNIFTGLIIVLLISISSIFAQSGNALSFNGSNQYVSVPYNAALDIPNGGTLTIECWIYPTGGANIITRDNYGYGLWVGGDNKLYYWDQSGMGSTIPTTGTIAFNKWQHIAVTVKDLGSSLSINFYINGIPDAGNPKTSSQAQINNGGGGRTLDIGIQARSSCGCNFYSGNIDELRIWNVERTAAEIKNNYLSEISASSTGLIAYYKFNNGSGTTLTDATSNGLNGTIYNSATWVVSGANIAVSHPGNALNLDGNNDYMSNNSFSNLGGSSFTLESWFNSNSIPSSKQFIVSIGSGGGISYAHTFLFLNGNGSSAQIQTGFYGEDLIYNWTHSTGWHHVAFTFNNSSKLGILYLDGTNVANKVFASGFSGSDKLVIGSSTWATGIETFNGALDETRIWNTERTASEIENNWTSIVDPTSSGLVAYYRFDEGISSGTNTGVSSLLDLTSYQNHATLNNFGLSGSTSNWVAANNAALPVELTSFTANLIDGNVLLNWQTATEVNNYGFEVERASTSLDMTTWEKIGFVQGHGNSNSPKTYSFTDASPLYGFLRYRLKQIDFDGKFEYSSVIEVKVDTPVSFALNQNHPNPFNPETIISYQLPSAGIVSLKVFDVLGKEVAELVNELKASGSHEIKFDGRNLPSGIYFYTLRSGNYVQTKKLMLVK